MSWKVEWCYSEFIYDAWITRNSRGPIFFNILYIYEKDIRVAKRKEEKKSEGKVNTCE